MADFIVVHVSDLIHKSLKFLLGQFEWMLSRTHIGSDFSYESTLLNVYHVYYHIIRRLLLHEWVEHSRTLAIRCQHSVRMRCQILCSLLLMLLLIVALWIFNRKVTGIIPLLLLLRIKHLFLDHSEQEASWTRQGYYIIPILDPSAFEFLSVQYLILETKSAIKSSTNLLSNHSPISRPNSNFALPQRHK